MRLAEPTSAQCRDAFAREDEGRQFLLGFHPYLAAAISEGLLRLLGELERLVRVVGGSRADAVKNGDRQGESVAVPITRRPLRVWHLSQLGRDAFGISLAQRE